MNQSDLADADSRLLGDENNRYLQKVAGGSGFLLWTTPYFDISFEALGAIKMMRMTPMSMWSILVHCSLSFSEGI
ncbi:MAG: hypothetical protein ABFS39_05705 [Pseudomonadota bacterium]